ncbi:hypothetical protein FRX31_017044 [Thalictrum thalictroides]|uniref:Uncharacterized protein n=1 Tax=Thalictrum thalictroides TaxID=46969 RepID=A0A7J6W9V1_THATH|nr:hypothetical protein FRX31_017044 [Thalictrum thalictroides]
MNVFLRRFWVAFARSLGIHHTGLQKLTDEVKTCEYDDVHIMWKLLKKTQIDMAESPTKKLKRHLQNIFQYVICR